MSRITQLSFDVTSLQELSEFDDREYLSVQVRARVDGRSLYAQPEHENVFDAVEVLVRGVRSGEFQPFTCSCGVSECAGIVDEAQLEADERCVRWRFPKGPFLRRLSPELESTDDGVVVAFDRDQYETALRDLTQRIEAMTASHGRAYGVMPCSGPLRGYDGPLFSQFVVQCKAAADEAEAERAARVPEQEPPQ